MTSLAKQTAVSDVSLPKDTYIYALARLSSSIACIASDDTLSLLDTTTLKLKHKIESCHESVTSLTSVAGSKNLATAGRDGLVKVWDEKRESPITTLSIPNGQGISAIAVNENFVAAGTENTKEGPGDVGVYVWDIRSPKTPLRSYLESHNDTITTLSFSTSSPHGLLSSSTDALLTLFDTTQAEEDDAIQQVFNHSAAVHLASFLADDEIAAISSDEALSIYEVSKPEDVENEEVHALSTTYGDVREQLKATYVAQIVQSAGETWVACGNLEGKEMRLTPLVRTGEKTKWIFDYSRGLLFPEAHGEEVVRDVLLDESSRTVVTCGEDGMVRVWSVPDADGGGMDVEQDEEKSRKEKKKRKQEKWEKERFKPY
ncbi:WD domain-containing protein 38 [Elsinoe fawcettii]|nr:WD domain-containing protein 38 [Elsinoe fawcettii]